MKFVSEIHQLQHWAEIYITAYPLVKSAAATQSRLQCNCFNLELTESYTSQVEEAFLQGVDFVVPSNYFTVQVIQLEHLISRVFYASWSWSLISLLQFLQLGMQFCIGSTNLPPKKCFKFLIISTFEIVLPLPALNCFREKGSFTAPMLYSASINKKDHFLTDNWRIKNTNCLIAFSMEKSEGNKNSLDVHKGNALGWKRIFYTCLYQ